MSKHRKSVFITGAATGIGRAAALRFAAEGWFVGLYDINHVGVAALAAELGEGRALAGALDVSNYAVFEAALKSFVKAAGGRLDVLVNNAGILSCGAFESMAIERQQAIVAVNAMGVVNGCRAAHPYLRLTKGARVINLSSASAIYGSPSFAVYSASKFFVRGLTESLNLEWQGQGIAVCDLMPLFVDTPMLSGVNERPPSIARMGVRLTASDISNAIWQLASCRRPPVHTLPGLQTRVLAAAQKWLPAPLYRLSTRLVSGY